jgi:hypothetical protein
MILLSMLGCATPEPTTEPAKPPLHTEVLELRQAMSRASSGVEAACEALEVARTLAPQVDAAVRNGTFDWEERGSGAPGLLQTERGVEVDWTELALAMGPGPANVALITVGGVPRGPCADPAALARWTTRGTTLEAAPACMKETLSTAYADAIAHSLDRCLCTDPSAIDPAVPQVLASKLRAMGLEATAVEVEAWPERWAACADAPAVREP